ncbi:MAG: hypothetical protein RL212_1303 [Pseudomonadota bacterium]|jgi:hypothetical protein
MSKVATDFQRSTGVNYPLKAKDLVVLDYFIGYISYIGLVGVACGLAFVLGQYYISGDPVIYQEYYRNVSTLSLDDGYLYYRNNTGGIEPIYFLLTWIASQFFEKYWFDAILNSILLVLGLRYLNKNCVRKFLIPLLLINFYVFIMIFSADRLKLGFIIFLWGGVLGEKKGWVLFVTSVFAHVQMAVPAALYGIVKFCNRPLKRVLFPLFVGALAMSAILLLFPQISEYISGKFDFYSRDVNIVTSIAKVMVFVILIFRYNFQQPRLSIVISIALVLLSGLIGSDRVVMIAYFVFLYFGLRVNNGLNFGVIATSFYFSAKAGLFVYSVLTIGNAFPDEFLLN